MPIHDYICPSCRYKAMDVPRKLDDMKKKMVCPKCSKEMEILHSPVPFTLKGKGWGSTGRR